MFRMTSNWCPKKILSTNFLLKLHYFGDNVVCDRVGLIALQLLNYLTPTLGCAIVSPICIARNDLGHYRERENSKIMNIMMETYRISIVPLVSTLVEKRIVKIK